MIYNLSFCCKFSFFEIFFFILKLREKNRKEKLLYVLILLLVYNVGLRGLYLDE